jgi:hypothetical protein
LEGGPALHEPDVDARLIDDGGALLALAAPDGSATTWVIERDAISSGTLRPAPGGVDGALQLDYALGASEPAWVAAVLALPPAARQALAIDSVVRLRLRASQPLRLSVQLRSGSETRDLRWRRSVFLDVAERAVVLPVATFDPVGPDAASQPLASADGLLLVIDRTNAAAGASGTIWIDEVAVEPQ